MGQYEFPNPEWSEVSEEGREPTCTCACVQVCVCVQGWSHVGGVAVDLHLAHSCWVRPICVKGLWQSWGMGRVGLSGLEP